MANDADTWVKRIGVAVEAMLAPSIAELAKTTTALQSELTATIREFRKELVYVTTELREQREVIQELRERLARLEGRSGPDGKTVLVLASPIATNSIAPSADPRRLTEGERHESQGT